MPQEIDVPLRDPEQFRSLLPPERFEEFRRAEEEARELLDGRIVWNVNSSARGGGVAELLRPLVGYARAAGVDARWVVIDGSPGFFDVTKRIHNRIHGSLADGGPLARWDTLKDPIGVIRGFAEHVLADTGTHLVCAGPSVEAVSDDPEGMRILQDSFAARSLLPSEERRRVHLATLPMDDPDENAVMVNALQRHARVIAQKSLAEGFGLTVAEAMWKARPVVASKVGGIQEQIVHGESGILLDDPRDLEGFGNAITELLREPERAEEIGRNARDRVRDRFLSARSLLDYLAVIRRLLGRAG
jgi:trehalose synthase